MFDPWFDFWSFASSDSLRYFAAGRFFQQIVDQGLVRLILFCGQTTELGQKLR